MIDRELVTRKLVLISADLTALDEMARTPLVEYLASATAELVTERLLERVIGRMIDVNYHLLTESGAPPPSDDHASFVELGRLGVVDRDVARRIAACAGLRNRLVHLYDAIDPAKIHGALAQALVDVPTWMQAVRDYLDRLAP